MRSGGSVARRLSVAIVLTVAAALLLAGAGFVSYDAGHYRRELVRHARVVADLVGANGLTALAFDDPEFAAEILASIAADANVRVACLYAQDRLAYARFGRDGSRDATRCPDVSNGSARFDGGLLHLHRPVQVDGLTVAHLYLEVDASPLTAQLLRLVEIVALVLAASLAAAFLLSHRFRRAISEPIADLTDCARRMATGDLSRPLESQRGDELGRLASAFGAMGAQLADLVRRVRGNAADVSEAMDSLRSVSNRIQTDTRSQDAAVDRTAAVLERMGSSIGRVNESVETLSVNADATAASATQMQASSAQVDAQLEQLFEAIDSTASSTSESTANIASVGHSLAQLHEAVRATSAALERLAAAGAVAHASANDNRELSSRTADTARAGLAALDEAVAGIEAVRSSFGEIQRAVRDLSGRMESIQTIVGNVEGLADESSLLALNAQIIAAQAGDRGRGFAVVAQQMKGLAGQTSGSAAEIAELIGYVKQAAETAVAAVAHGSERMLAGVARTHEVGRVFSGFSEIAERLQGMGDRIAEATRDQDAGVDQVQASMAEMERGVARIARAVEEQDSASLQIARAAASMRELGGALRTASGEQTRESELIATAVAQVKKQIDEILQATREQAGDGPELDAALAVFRATATASSDRAAELEGVVVELAERSRSLESGVDRFRV